nr:hypothetical protein [Pseudomonas putida]
MASRDYGGERYAFELDEQGNMIGLSLPDGKVGHLDRAV